MTPEEFRVRMAEIAARDRVNDDPEVPHGEADALLCETLRALGYGEGVALFETSIAKWYA